MPGLPTLRTLDLSYDGANSDESAKRLIFALLPQWETDPGELIFKHFTDGITNTLLRATKVTPGATPDELDSSSVLIRAYGRGTEVLIDREREIRSHHLLALHRLAPELLARFKNGMIYRFVAGRPCGALDLGVPRVYRGLAQKMGEWHAVISVNTQTANVGSGAEGDGHNGPVKEPGTLTDGKGSSGMANGSTDGKGPKKDERSATDDVKLPNKVTPNVWTILGQWLDALPSNTPEEHERNALLKQEYREIVAEFGNRVGLGEDSLVVGHCDLLCGNIIIKNKPPCPSPLDPEVPVLEVGLIDYEYATPCPAAFDLACHFSEWIGYDCDYSLIPGKSARRAFLAEYLHSYRRHARRTSFNHLRDERYQVTAKREDSGEKVPQIDEAGNGNRALKSRADAQEAELDRFCAEIDLFRGLPGFWWGVWAYIQASISDIDFDYTLYAQNRLGEYWSWKGEKTGSRAREGKELPLREARWNSEI